MQSFIKWSGSKRSQSAQICALFPKEIGTFYEPFLGSGAIVGELKPAKAVLSDINQPLMELWGEIQNHPEYVLKQYERMWGSLQNEGHTFFYKVRDRFNKSHKPCDLLFLTRTCVNGLIRFNKAGEFNNSLHHTRPGISPTRLGKIILEWNKLISGYSFSSADYREATSTAQAGDFVYLDPPYFHTGTRYFGAINYEEFLEYLQDLNERGVKFALSFDGTRGDKSYTVDIPKHLYKRHIFLESGLSTFNKVQKKKKEPVRESLYTNY